jgi:hypothetical protein
MFTRIFTQRHLAVATGLGGLAVSMVAFASNQTEEYRMAAAIKQGRVMPTYPAAHDKRFCQFPTSQIKDVIYSSPNLFCGLVGVKSTGKSTELEAIASQEENVVYIVRDGTQGRDLDDVLYETMRESIWRMPWLLSQIRLPQTSRRRKMVENVFSMVLEDTKVPVTIVIDLSYEKESTFGADMTSMEGVADALGSGTAIGLSSFSPRQFVKEIKHYVVDVKLARCLFAASEGLLFQELSHYEPRLQLFIAGELSLDMATQYLAYLTTVDMPGGSSGPSNTDAHLSMFPRTFASLKKYSLAKDKKVFVQTAMRWEEVKVQESFACVGWLQSKVKGVGVGKVEGDGLGVGGLVLGLKYLARNQTRTETEHPVKQLYEIALTRPIDCSDYANICGLSKQQFITHFVKTNIFQQTASGTFELQFDATRQAVNKLL